MSEKDYAPQKSESKKMIVSKSKKKPEDVLKKNLVTENENLETTGETKASEEKKKPIVKHPIQKKTEAVVNVKSLPISTKHSMAICKFIKGKKINECIEYLEQVIVKKKAMPMRGEIPHRKGKMMSGRFPKNASACFITILKSLGANASVNNLDEPVIFEAIANYAPRPSGKFGRTKKKRTHVTIKVKEKSSFKKRKKKNK